MIKRIEDEKTELSKGLPAREEFAGLINSYLETIQKTTDIIEKDLAYREVVLNLRAGNDAVPVIKLNPPYDDGGFER